MAVTVTANLTLASDADTASSQGTWSGNSGGADTEVKIQGNGSYTWQASKNAATSCTFTPTTNLDMSAADTHLYWWARNDVAPFMENKTTGSTTPSGYMIRLTDGSGNYKTWHIAGKDTWGGEWKCFVLDVSNTSEVYASSGTLSLSDIDIITFTTDISNSGNIRIIDNQWNDVIRFGTGLTLTGTDFDLADAAAIDESSTNRYGILENIDDQIFCQGRLTIGNGATTTTFNSTDEGLVFRNRVGSGNGIVKSGLYKLVFTGSGCTSVINGLVAKGAGTTDTTRFALDASDTNHDLTINGSTFIRAGLITFASGNDILTSVFNNCLQIDPDAAVFQDNTISNYSGSEGGALLWPYNSNTKNLVFIENSNGVELDTTAEATFDGLTFDDVSGKYDVNNTSGSSVTVNKSGGSNPNSYNTGGSAVTFVGTITLSITSLIAGSDVVIYSSSTGSVLDSVDQNLDTDWDYVYGSGGSDIDVGVFKAGYRPYYVRDYTLPTSNGTLPVAQQIDRDYIT